MKKIFICLASYLLSATLLQAGDIAQYDTSNFERVEAVLRKIDRRKSEQQSKSVQMVSNHATGKEGESLNWCGYVAAADFKKPKKELITHVKGTWIVPELTLTSKEKSQFSAIWVGIDGYIPGNPTTIQQIGTEHDYWINNDGTGVQENYAWIAMYPHDTYEIENFPMKPGDFICGEMSYTENKIFHMHITNFTQNISIYVDPRATRSKEAKRYTAQWIVEGATETSYNNPTPLLANFGTIQFTNCFMAINGKDYPINDSKWKQIPLTMVKPPVEEGEPMIIRAIPSELDDNNGFTVTWQSE